MRPRRAVSVFNSVWGYTISATRAMVARSLAIFLWLNCGFVPCAISQQSGSALPPSDPEAVRLLRNALVAVGGSQKAQLADVRIEGTLHSPLSPDATLGTFVAKVRGEDWSLRTTIGNSSWHYAVLKGAGTIDNGNSIKFLHPSITFGTRLDLFPLFQRWTEFDQPGSIATIVGPVTVDGVTYTKLHVHSATAKLDPSNINEHGDVDVFVDPGTGLIAAIRYKAMLGMPNPHAMEVETRFAQYERFGGLMAPSRVTEYMAGRPRMVLQIVSVRTNNGFTDADFHNHGGNGK